MTAETSQTSCSENPQHRTTEKSLHLNETENRSSQIAYPQSVSTQQLTETEKRSAASHQMHTTCWCCSVLIVILFICLFSPPWTILGDESLDRSMTIPSFFHSGYCLPNVMDIFYICFSDKRHCNIIFTFLSTKIWFNPLTFVCCFFFRKFAGLETMN